MRIYDFVEYLTDCVDAAAARDLPAGAIVAGFVAPSSGFCGPSYRPKYLGDADPAHGRYGLTLDQGRRLLHALTGRWPARSREEQDA